MGFELIISIIISVLSITFAILTFSFSRKDKTVKDSSSNAYSQGRIEEKLSNIEKSLGKIEEQLRTYDVEIKQIVKEEIKNHIIEYHNQKK